VKTVTKILITYANNPDDKGQHDSVPLCELNISLCQSPSLYCALTKQVDEL